MTTQFGLIGNTTSAPNVCAPNNVLIAQTGSNFTYTPGTTYVFNTVSTIGSNPACSLNTTTGVFTCNLEGTYIIFADPLFVSLASNEGVVGSVWVNGGLYQECCAFNTRQQFVGNNGTPQLDIPMFATLYDTVPGTTFTFQISYTGGSSMSANSSSSGAAAHADVLYFA